MAPVKKTKMLNPSTAVFVCVPLEDVSTQHKITDGSDGEVSACNAGDLGSIPGSGRSPGEGKGNPLQYSCLENSTDGGAW